MKSAFVLAFVASLGLAHAQGSMSECSRKCLSNMMDLAEDLGCSAGEMSCICSKVDFEYGIRDCTKEACPEDDPSAAISAALAQCPNQSATGSLSGSASATETDNETGSSTGSANPTETGDESSSSTGSGSPTSESVETVTTSSPISTDEIISTITDETETFESTIGHTTMFTEVTNTRTGSDPEETGDDSGSGGDGDDATDNEGGTAAPTDDGDSAGSRAIAGTGLMGALGLLALIAA